MSDSEPATLADYLRINLARVVDAAGSRSEMAKKFDMYPPQLSRLLNSDAGWTALIRLEGRMRRAGLDPLELLGPAPRLRPLFAKLNGGEIYYLGRLLDLIGEIPAADRERWLRLWVESCELALAASARGPEAHDEA